MPTEGTSRAAAARAGGGEAPETARDALAAASEHLRNAAIEALAAARALLDAAALATLRQDAGAHPRLGVLARGIDELAASVSAGGSPVPTPLLEAILEALDSEIRRWEVRSREDAEARAVLRAFLGLREILWEFGVRPRDAQSGEGTHATEGREAADEPRATAGQAGSREAADPKREKKPAARASTSGGARRERAARRTAPRVQRIEIR